MAKAFTTTPISQRVLLDMSMDEAVALHANLGPQPLAGEVFNVWDVLDDIITYGDSTADSDE